MNLQLKKTIRLSLALACLLALFGPVNPVRAQDLSDEYRLAAGFYSRGQWEETATAFRSLIARFPNTPEAAKGHFFLGEALMQQAEYGEAYNVYQVFIQRQSKHLFVPRATFRMGEAALRMGNLESAMRLLEIYVRQNPHDDLNEFALPYLGEIRLKREEPQLAQRAYETALRLYPNSSLSNKVRLGLAKSFQMQGADEQAIRFYQFLAQDPKNPLAGEAELRIGIFHFQAGDHEAARSHLLDAVPNCHEPESRAESAYWLARTYMHDEDFQKAFEIFESHQNLDANERLASAMYFDGAVAAMKVDRNPVAIQWLTQLRQKYPLNGLADDAMQMQIELEQTTAKPQELIELTEVFLKEYPNSPGKPQVKEMAGRAYFALEDFQNCVRIFRELLAEDKHVSEQQRLVDQINWNYLLGLGHLGLREFEQAEAALSLVDTKQASEDVKPLIEISLATARFGSKKYVSAIANYRNYLQLEPDGNEVLRARTELTVALAESGRWQETVKAFDELHENHQDEDIVLETADYLASKATQTGRQKFASQWYEFMSTVGNPPDIMARGISSLAWIKLEEGDTDSAMKLFDRLLAECPESKFACEGAMARAKLLEDKGDFAEAAQLYGLVLRRFRDNEMANVACLRRAYALQKSGDRNDLVEAKTLLTEYLQLPPSVAHKDEAIYQLAWISHDLKLPDDAFDKFQQLIDEYPQSKYWSDAAYRIAQRHFNQGRTELSETLIEELVSRPDIPDEVRARGLYLQGELAAKTQRWEDVENAMRRLSDSTAGGRLKSKADYWLAESLYRQKQFQPAVEIFEKLQAEDGMVEAAVEPWVWLRMAQCQGQLNQWSRAVKTAVDGKTRFPRFESDYEFDFVIGRGCEDAGELDRCRLAYQQVVDSERGGSTETAAIAQWRIGETFFHQENYKAAIDAYYKVDSLYSYPVWRGAALIQAGKCQEHLGNWKHAMKLYRQLLEKFPQSEYAADAKKRLERVVLLAQIQQETETR